MFGGKFLEKLSSAALEPPPGTWSLEPGTMLLPSNLSLDPSLTASGLSSGSFMGHQFHVAFSSDVVGAALFAGGPYYCAQASLTLAEDRCMRFGDNIPLDELHALTVSGSMVGNIDNPENLAGDPIFVFSGTADTVVDQSVGRSLANHYSSFNSNVMTALTSKQSTAGQQ